MTDDRRPPAPEAAIDFGGKRRVLRCDMMAFRLFKQETGLSLLRGEHIEVVREEVDGELKEVRRSKLDEDSIPELIWAFLVHEQKDLTVEDVASMVTLDNMNPTIAKVFDLIAQHGAKRRATGEDASDDPLGPTGSPSTS